MKLTSPSQVRELLGAIGVQPSSALGQCFLIDGNIRDLIVAAACPGPGDVVLEVGPGLGVLTEVLIRKADRVIAVEKDGRLSDYLRQRFDGVPSLRIVHSDYLDLDPGFIAAEGVTRIVSNLPYSVGSRILMDAFALPEPPQAITVTVQSEVAERLAAAPGEAEWGLLSVWAQRVYAVEILKGVSAACFSPRPKVRSAIVQMTRREAADRALADPLLFQGLTRAAFAFRRKQLGAILHRIAGSLGVRSDAALAALAGLGIEARTRPERLSVDDWRRLTDRLSKIRGRPAEGVS